MEQNLLFDVIIVGGSYSGLSAAMTLGRSLRKVLVIDSGKPCNRQTPHSHNFLTRDGETPANIGTIAREQVLRYPSVSFLSDLATKAYSNLDGFVIETDGGQRVRSRKLILATGVEDLMPPISGFAECWGRSVLHCPYCHGYEVAGQRLGVLANGDTAYELVYLIQHWSANLTLFTNGPATLSPDQRQRIDQLNVPIIETTLTAIAHDQGQLTELQFADGSTYAVDALYSRVPFRQHSDLAKQLGCAMTESGLVDTSGFGKTNVPGVFTAGDNSSPMRQVSMAVTNGSLAGVWVNRELIEEGLSARPVQAIG
ncbi:NAD(P)/FAD-dependent oxidoreductase [Spirosoma radiotolerans]|uniref:Pyridine nucleotide-disulfide oxidoreductase n=1 Tax=Spirosoma radiotolerans TaxID=1379870 RepID=A0A0E3V9Y1_9BACT|nr:NAD(P)/FAD-dependent oxidoreductase [Spirosoma radiotolerans]AKD57581.1 pyridine nucleotide-disulfide oxidoreductase [Spirosoma radiotolerans]